MKEKSHSYTRSILLKAAKLCDGSVLEHSSEKMRIRVPITSERGGVDKWLVFQYCMFGLHTDHKGAILKYEVSAEEFVIEFSKEDE
jgi:hypothetical protein